ncbi:MAG: hypothetical protein ACHQHN_08195 [Sphingobacteriales bacterium]
MIGKCEGEEAVPSIEVARKIAQAFDVSLDYLAGEVLMLTLMKTVRRVQDIEDLSSSVNESCFFD